MTYSPSLEDLGIHENENSDNYSPSISDLLINELPQSNKEMVPTFLGEMQDISSPERRKELYQPSKSELEKSIKKAGSMALPLVAPEIKAIPVISNILSKIPGAASVGNMLGRIGYGTALTTAPHVFSEEGRENIGEKAGLNAMLNAALEGLTLPFRGASSMAELFNPVKYTRNKAQEIKNEFTAAKATTDEMYRPVNEAYNDFKVTITPKNYLLNAGIKRKDLYPDAKIIYDDFLKDPTFGNLHNLQSKLGNDWAKTAKLHPEKGQLFKQMRDTLQDRAQHFLSRDPNALKQYNLASDYAKNYYFPYTSTPTLRKIAKGKMDVSPKLLRQSIKRGIEKGIGQEEKSVIPEFHPLRNHLKDLEHKINIGEAASFAVPAVAGGIGGELLHPGLGGLVGGFGVSQIPAIAAKFGAPTMTGFVQNPLVQNAFTRANPYYYGLGRAGIGYSQDV